MYDQLPPEGRWEVDAQILRLMGINRPEAIIGEKPATSETSTPAPIPQTHPLMGLSVPEGMINLAGGELPLVANEQPTDSVGLIG
jgi:hypothetical protein